MCQKDLHGIAPLHWAARNGYKDVAELLLAKGADVNAKTNKGTTPLSIAIQNHHDDVAALLRVHGANERIRWSQ